MLHEQRHIEPAAFGLRNWPVVTHRSSPDRSGQSSACGPLGYAQALGPSTAFQPRRGLPQARFSGSQSTIDRWTKSSGPPDLLRRPCRCSRPLTGADRRAAHRVGQRITFVFFQRAGGVIRYAEHEERALIPARGRGPLSGGRPSPPGWHGICLHATGRPALTPAAGGRRRNPAAGLSNPRPDGRRRP